MGIHLYIDINLDDGLIDCYVIFCDVILVVCHLKVRHLMVRASRAWEHDRKRYIVFSDGFIWHRYRHCSQIVRLACWYLNSCAIGCAQGMDQLCCSFKELSWSVFVPASFLTSSQTWFIAVLIYKRCLIVSFVCVFVCLSIWCWKANMLLCFTSVCLVLLLGSCSMHAEYIHIFRVRNIRPLVSHEKENYQ